MKTPSRWGLWLSLGFVTAAGTLACAGEEEDGQILTTGSGGSVAVGGQGGDAAGGAGNTGGTSLCDEDCSEIETPQCLMAVCNDGSHPGQVGSCVVVNAPTGTECEDGLFCTVDDVCAEGQCLGGPQNDCGEEPPACSVVTCDEATQTCGVGPAGDGSPCVPSSLCEINGTCQGGECTGTPKDCSFSPLSECNSNLVCDPATGACGGTPDPAKDGAACSLSGDPCMSGKTCSNGLCQGGAPKDCSALTVGCNNGVCNPQTGSCEQEAVPAGGVCFDGIAECNTGTCDASGMCVASPVPNGTTCNDYNSCTSGDVCSAGACSGTPIVGCQVYFEDNFDAGCPPSGWTLGIDWECGTPTSVGPTSALSGTNVVATKIAGNYSNGLSYDTSFAETPPIDLGSSTEPTLAFWAYVDTEGSSFDGFNVKVSTDGGASFTQVTGVQPAYNLTVNLQPAWGGHQQALGYQQFLADLTPYVGQQVILRFSFRTDGSIVYPGVYIDDVSVSEASLVPLVITTGTNLPDALTGAVYSAQLTKGGGTSGSEWSIQGGTNIAWLTIDPATGLLGGTPTAGDAGPVSVTVRVQEPAAPSNFDEVTFTFDVFETLFVQDFEGACPNGWVLTGDWQCGTPTLVGPSGAFSGIHVLATQLASTYNQNQTYAGCYAQSPLLDLTGTTAPSLSFRAYVDTEGSSFDGFNVKVSTDGVNFSPVTGVTPAYNLTVGGEPAWGGHQQALGYQLFVVDLAAYAGQQVNVRFEFRSDGSIVYPGVYIDDVALLD